LSNKAKQIDEEFIRSEDPDRYARLAMQYDFEKNIRIGLMEQSMAIKRERNQKVVFIFISTILSVLILLATIMVRSYRNRARLAMLQKGFHDLENQKIRQEQDALQREIDIRDRQLAEKALSEVQKNEFIASIADQLVQIRRKIPELCGAHLDNLEILLRRDSGSGIWKEFEVRFQEVHKDFYQTLNEKFPHLTRGEKKLASLLRLNLSSKEISAITYQSPDSIKVARSRLRKKLGLAKEEDVISFLEKLR